MNRFISTALKASLFILNCVLLSHYSSAQIPVFVKKIGGGGSEASTSIVVDASGNSYITGSFSGTVNFDPGIGTAYLSSAGGDDIFFAKYDADGKYVYAKSIGGTSDDYGNKIAVDISGNCYITGYYWGTADFNPGAGTVNLTPVAYDDIFFAKYDSSGNYIYAKNIGSYGNDIGYGIVADTSGNCYITGFFQGNADFNPGAGVANLSPTNGNAGIYFAKYDAIGNYVYAKSINTSIAGFGHDIAIDAAGNCYITGTYWGTADFDPGAGTATFTAADGWHLYLAKYDASGNYSYANSLGTVGGNNNYAMVADASGNCYLTGNFSGSSDFDPGAGVLTLTSAGADDIYFAKFDTAGKLIYAKSIGAANGDYGNGIATDALGNCYLTGWFEGSVDFDPGAGTAFLSAAGTTDIFYAKFDLNGNYVCAKNIGSTGYNVGTGISLDNSGNAHLTGSFEGTTDFDPGAGTSNLSADGSSDIFLLKVAMCTPAPLPVTLLHFDGTAEENSNRLFWQTASEINTSHFTIEKSSNGINWQALGIVAAARNSNTILSYGFSDAAISGLINFYRLKSTDNNGGFSYSGIVTIKRSYPGGKERLVLYPNPAKDMITLQFNSAAGNALIEMFNVLGIRVFTGSNVKSIPVAAFAHGMYFVNIQQGNRMLMGKFIKQ